MNARFSGIAIHTWTIDTTPVLEALDVVRSCGADAIELRHADFERARKLGVSLVEAVQSRGLAVSAVGVEYGWVFASGAEQSRLFGVFREQSRAAVALGCDLVMSAPGRNTGTLRQASESVREAGDIAAEHGLRLCFEWNRLHPLIDSLERAREVIAAAQRPNVGLLLDTYHLHQTGRSGRGFEDLSPEEIFYVQFSDVAAMPPEPPSLTDRLPPGQGTIPWPEVLELLREKRYAGYLSYEAPNPDQWRRAPADVVAEGLSAIRRFVRDLRG
jgi:sugar phosphate isomerase/epimerase